MDGSTRWYKGYQFCKLANGYYVLMALPSYTYSLNHNGVGANFDTMKQMKKYIDWLEENDKKS